MLTTTNCQFGFFPIENHENLCFDLSVGAKYGADSNRFAKITRVTFESSVFNCIRRVGSVGLCAS